MTISPYQKLDIFNTLRYGDFGVEKSATGGESLKSSMKKDGGVKSKVMKTICKKVVTFGSNANSPTAAGKGGSQRRGFETEVYEN